MPTTQRALTVFLSATCAVLNLACGGSSGGTTASSPPPVSPPASQPSPAAADVMVLMMGNSHTSYHNVPAMVQSMLRAGPLGANGRTVSVTQAPGWMFLDERLSDAATLALLSAHRWSVVVLQAQKYSSSGTVTYSTAEAQQLVRRSRAVGALPVMFPEWPRRGIAETDRIYQLHVSIATAEPACVAPIGQAWDLALTRHPALVLHDADGNHSAPAGAFLAALVLYATISKQSPAAVPTLDGIAVDAATQALLRAVAADAVTATAPRQHCPADGWPS